MVIQQKKICLLMGKNSYYSRKDTLKVTLLLYRSNNSETSELENGQFCLQILRFSILQAKENNS
jgi:hypothetical protein